MPDPKEWIGKLVSIRPGWPPHKTVIVRIVDIEIALKPGSNTNELWFFAKYG